MDPDKVIGVYKQSIMMDPVITDFVEKIMEHRRDLIGAFCIEDHIKIRIQGKVKKWRKSKALLYLHLPSVYNWWVDKYGPIDRKVFTTAAMADLNYLGRKTHRVVKVRSAVWVNVYLIEK